MKESEVKKKTHSRRKGITTMTIAIPEDMKRQIEEAAREEGRSVTQYVIREINRATTPPNDARERLQILEKGMIKMAGEIEELRKMIVEPFDSRLSRPEGDFSIARETPMAVANDKSPHITDNSCTKNHLGSGSIVYKKSF